MKSTPCQQLTKVIVALCDDVATPVSNLVKGYALSGEWNKLQQLKVRPSDYPCAESYLKDSVCVDLLRKTSMDTGLDRRAAAVETFWACESQNAKTNARLRRYLPDLLVIENQEDGAMVRFIELWRKEISNCLRKLPDHLDPGFGKGSTYGDRGLLTTIPDKMSGTPTITSDAVCLSPLWEQTAWFRSLIRTKPYGSAFEVVRGNRFTTVPKSGETDRGICIEPSLNVSYQLAVGQQIKQLLLRKGIDLTNGQTIHRERAQAQSLWDGDATIDLSNASDTICAVLVQLLLPAAWFELLDSLRSKFTLIDGQWVRCEKFSSMGCGFTFELETLIFSTLARVICACEGADDRRVLCYGDDLIIPKTAVAAFKAALAFFGFTPNERKSFDHGPFRESCGGDFWKGVPVRAHYLKELPNEPHHWISLANGLYRVGHSDPCSNARWSYLRRAHRLCLDSLPSNIRRLTGPSWLGDLVVRHDDPSAWKVRHKRVRIRTPSGHSIECSSFPILRVWAPVQMILQWDHWKPETQLAAALYGLPSTGVAPRDGISGYRESYANLIRNDWLPEPYIIL